MYPYRIIQPNKLMKEVSGNVETLDLIADTTYYIKLDPYYTYGFNGGHTYRIDSKAKTVIIERINEKDLTTPVVALAQDYDYFLPLVDYVEGQPHLCEIVFYQGEMKEYGYDDAGNWYENVVPEVWPVEQPKSSSMLRSSYGYIEERVSSTSSLIEDQLVVETAALGQTYSDATGVLVENIEGFNIPYTFSSKFRTLGRNAITSTAYLNLEDLEGLEDYAPSSDSEIYICDAWGFNPLSIDYTDSMNFHMTFHPQKYKITFPIVDEPEPEPTSTSILQDVKKLLSVPDNYDVFDLDISIWINSAFSTLHELGVGGQSAPFQITGPTETWLDFTPDETMWNNVKTYVYLRARLGFDPPQSAHANAAMQKMVEEHEWRLNVKKEGDIL